MGLTPLIPPGLRSKDFESAVNGIPAAILVADPTGLVTYVNEGWLVLAGQKIEEALGVGWIGAIHPEYRNEVLEDWMRAVRDKTSLELHFTLSRSDGIVCHAQGKSTPLKNDSGDIVGFCGTVSDVTSLKRVDKFNTFYKMALDKAADVAFTDSKGRIIYANDMFCISSGYTRGELLGQNHRIVNSGKMSPEFFKGMWATIKSGQVWHGEICNKKKDGSIYWVDATIIPFLGRWGKPERYISIRKDITKQKLQQEELEAVSRRAEDATRAKTEFLANMSHEIRTPINGIVGLTELLRDTPLTDIQKEYLEGIQFSADGLLTIINDILDLSKVEARKLDLENVDFELVSLLQEIFKVQRVAAKRRQTNFESYIQSELPSHVSGDPTRIRQVLLNLINNAIKFAPGGLVEVRVLCESSGASGYSIRFEIKDNGIGIPKEALERIFLAFSQVDASTSRRFGGTGLGLSISKKLVDLMGGKIGVESQEGKGAMFWFTVPLRKGVVLEPLGPQVLESTNVPSRTAKKLLVVEDNQMNQKIIMAMLQKLGYRASVVGTGDEAIDSLRQFNFDLILMDCQMPGRDGFETTKIIRSGSVRGIENIPIIALTANALQGDREKCLAAGMTDYLSKPLRVIELEEMVDKYLQPQLVVNMNQSRVT